MNMAKEVATLSHCERHKVGAVLVKDDNVIGFGYNGMPKGMDNACENKNYMTKEIAADWDPETIADFFPFKDENGRHSLTTKDEVIHAEMNAILKAARHGYAVSGATLYLTLSPCKECSKLILQSGVKRVVYLQEYRNTEGLELLKKFIFVTKYDNKQ